MPLSVRYSVAAKLSGVPASTMRNRCDDGHAPLFTEHTPGKSRRFAVRDLIALAVMDELAARGVSLSDAAKITKEVLADLDAYCVATGRDDPSDIDAVGLRERTLFLWRDGDSRWQSRTQDTYGWLFSLAQHGIGETDMPRSAVVVRVGMIAKEVADRIRAFAAAKKGEKQQREGGGNE